MKKQKKTNATARVARPLVPAVPLPPPEDFGKPVDPDEARINREAAAAAIEGRRHMRSAERYRLAGGVPYKGKDKRLAGSIIHDREALDAFGELAEAEEREAERCIGELRRAQEELKDLRKLKALEVIADALRERNAAHTQTSPDDEIAESGRPAEIVQEEAVRDWWIDTPERPRGEKRRLDAFRVWVDKRWQPRTDANRLRRTIEARHFAALCERFRKTPPTAK